MIGRIVISVAVVYVLCWLWFTLQERGRRLAKKYPELGRYREEGGECGKTCGCANWKHCVKKSEVKNHESEVTDQNP